MPPRIITQDRNILLGQNIKKIRMSLKKTQEEVANEIGLSVISYRSIENGKDTFLSNIIKISIVFKKNIKDLFEGL